MLKVQGSNLNWTQIKIFNSLLVFVFSHKNFCFSVQNIKKKNGGQENGDSYFRFIRSQTPCDSNVTNQDRNVIQGTTKLIYAWNDNNIDITNVDS